MNDSGEDEKQRATSVNRPRVIRADSHPLRASEIPSIRVPGKNVKLSTRTTTQKPKEAPAKKSATPQTPQLRDRSQRQRINKDSFVQPPLTPAKQHSSFQRPAPRKAAPVVVQAPKKRRRNWLRYTLAIILVLFLITWIPVLVMRWVNPPTTAFMLETAAALESGHIQQNWVPYEDIAKPMRLAVVASEDQTFPYNHGFDVDAIQEAIDHNQESETTRGASTITQQTAKNLFLWPGGGYFRKAIEAWFAVLIDLDWSKRRVLEVYLNIAQFGPQIFGVEAAARHYFGKTASQLSAPEAALLAATLPNPQEFDPANPSPYLLERQQWILEQMDQLGPHYLDAL